jgi:VWFA-related protein
MTLLPVIRLRFVLALVGMLAATLALPAQQPSSSQQTPPFRTEADLVIVDATVFDRDDRPVSDLTAADFDVLDEGVPRRIQFFQPVSSAPLSTVRPVEPHRFSYSTNVGVDARPGRSFVIFFDDVHLTRELGEHAKKAIVAFLGSEVRHGDLVSLVVPGRALRWHARMPAGRDELLKVVQTLRGAVVADASRERMTDYEAYRIHVFHDEAAADRVDRRWNASRVGGREPTSILQDQGPRPELKAGTAGLIKPDIAIRAAEVYEQASARNRVALIGLERAILGLQDVRGRKSLILLSPGFIDDHERREPRTVIDAARRANVVLYFVDVKGLEAGTTFSNAETGVPLDARDLGAANVDAALGSQGAEALAMESGGFSIRNTNDLPAALSRIGRELSMYYLLGFEPGGSKRDEFRRLAVKVKRPGLTVRARRGYSPRGTPSVAAGASTGGVADDLERASESPYEMSAIPIRATAYVFGRSESGKAHVMVALETDLRAFTFRSQGGRLVDVLDLRLLTTHQETTTTAHHERQVEMSFEPTARFTDESWYGLTQELPLSPGRYQVRVAVRDRNSARIGALTHDFVVPPLDEFRVTSPIVTDTIETPAFGSQAPPKPVLVVRRTFPAGTTLYYQFNVLGAATSGSGPNVVAGHEVRAANGTVIKRMEPRPITPAQHGGLSRFSGISLAGVPAGDYELVLNVTDEIGQRSIELREAFSVLVR